MSNPSLHRERGERRWNCLKKFLRPNIWEICELMGCQEILQGAELLTVDSREMIENTIWIPLRGAQVDGHDLLETLGTTHCIVLVDIQKIPLPRKNGNALIIPVEHSEKFFNQFIVEFYDFPTKTLQVVGITGTNGKTSTTIFTKKLLSILGKSVGSIGTIGADFNGKNIDITNTTPNQAKLQQILGKMRDKKVQSVVLEMSSHGLALGRTNGIDLDVAVLMNVTQDHLDFHCTFENYLHDKMKILELLEKSPKENKGFFLWKSCQEKKKIMEAIPQVQYGEFSASQQSQEEARVHIQLGKKSIEGTEIRIFFCGEIVYEGFFPLLGEYNYINLAAAISVVAFLEQLSSKNLQNVLKELRENSLQIPGRMENVYAQEEKLIIVDYAHTPDALKNVLQAVKELPHKRILCLFGCGGGRDQTKREKMGTIASELSDVVFLTSDNPRNEDPQKIIEMIAKGVSNHVQMYQIQDRRDALQMATQYMQSGDILLVAGKGHETVQIIGNDRIPFDDRVVLQKFFQR